MAKTRFKTSKYGDRYDSRYYTTWNGLVVSRRALADANKKNYATDMLINSISERNTVAFSEREGGKVSGLADPKRFLQDLRVTSLKEIEEKYTKEGKQHKGKSKLDFFADQIILTSKSDLLTTEEQRVGANFGKMMNQAMDQTEKNDLRKFIGWKEGYNFKKAGFTWNAEEKRFEKEFNVDGVAMTKYIYINNEYITKKNGVRTYGAGALEYGIE